MVLGNSSLFQTVYLISTTEHKIICVTQSSQQYITNTILDAEGTAMLSVEKGSPISRLVQDISQWSSNG